MKKEKAGDIFHKEKVKFKNQKELEKYYEKKRSSGGYKKGYMMWGINISNMFQKARVKSVLKFLKPKKEDIILDAGCGEGKTALKVAKKCKKVYGIDIAKNAFTQSKSKAPKNVVFKKMNLENLKFKNNTFDKIFCIETLEHVLHPKKAIKEMKRVLKKQGILVLSYPTIDQTMIAKLNYFLGFDKPSNISEHLTEWCYGEIKKQFKTQGFMLVESEGIALNISLLSKLRYISKPIAMRLYKFRLSVKKLPRMSNFVTLVFKKK